MTETEKKLMGVLEQMVVSDRQKEVLQQGSDIDIINDLGLDSIQLMEYFINVEEAFQVELIGQVEHLESYTRVGNLAALLQQNAAK